MPLPVLGGREVRRLQWTVVGLPGPAEGRTREDVRRLHAVHSASLLAEEVGLVPARENSVFRAAQGELVSTLANVAFGAETNGVETAEMTFLCETQYMKDFLNSVDVDGSSEGTYFSYLEEVLQSKFTCVRDCYAFAMSESHPTIRHVNEVDNPPLRFSDIKHLKLKDLWDGVTKTEFNELVDLRVLFSKLKYLVVIT